MEFDRGGEAGGYLAAKVLAVMIGSVQVLKILIEEGVSGECQGMFGECGRKRCWGTVGGS